MPGALHRSGALALASAAAVMVATPALAACGPTPESVARAEVAFVGTLTHASADGAQAIFEIEEVWRGSGLSAGTSSPVFASPGMFPVPQAGDPALRYLVLARTVGGQLQTGKGCDLGFPYPWDASYAAFRPVNASVAPALDGTDGEGMSGAVLALVAVVAVIGTVGFLAFRSRTRAARIR